MISEELINNVSGNSNPTVWGPPTRHTLEHYIIAMSGKKDRKSLLKLFNIIAEIAPCDSCGKHFKEYIRTHPIPFNRAGILGWLFDAQNGIREKNGLPSLSEEEYLERIQKRINSVINKD